jgi:Flp pilus assembly CpaE family ATPase
VVDCGFSVEQDEELSYDTAAPRRNGATLTVLDQADTVLLVAAADPVGLGRGVRALGELREGAPGPQPRVVVNKVRRSAAGGEPRAQVRETLRTLAGVERLALLPYDLAALDAAVLAGRTLAEAAPESPLRRAFAVLAAELVGVPAPRLRSGRRFLPRRAPQRTGG